MTYGDFIIPLWWYLFLTLSFNVQTFGTLARSLKKMAIWRTVLPRFGFRVVFWNWASTCHEQSCYLFKLLWIIFNDPGSGSQTVERWSKTVSWRADETFTITSYEPFTDSFKVAWMMSSLQRLRSAYRCTFKNSEFETRKDWPFNFPLLRSGILSR
jgi:hypothetical protein